MSMAVPLQCGCLHPYIIAKGAWGGCPVAYLLWGVFPPQPTTVLLQPATFPSRATTVPLRPATFRHGQLLFRCSPSRSVTVRYGPLCCSTSPLFRHGCLSDSPLQCDVSCYCPSRSVMVRHGPSRSVTVRHGPSRSVMVRHGPPRSATVRHGPPRRTEIRHGVPRTATARRGPLWLATGYVHMSGEMMTATSRDGQRSSALTSRDGVPSRRSVTGFRHVGCHI
jgi:hypothetical protein